MNRILSYTLLFLFSCTTIQAQYKSWALIRDRIISPWAEKVDPGNPLPEYPRPQLVRKNWKNLNGLWNYAVIPAVKAEPSVYEGQILVPFAVESALSGVGRTIGKDSLLWYHRIINIPADMRGKEVLLHFGAVDWQTEVFINGKSLGRHEGGFDPFSFNITSFLKKGEKQEIKVRVWDPTDQGPQPRGKQQKKPEGIWYTPVTGIWQTVWIEAVPKTYIASIRQTPDIDTKVLHVSADISQLQSGDQLKITAFDGQTEVSEQQIDAASAASLVIPEPKLWSPSSPFLYDLKLVLLRKGKVIDEVSSYFAMRKSSMAPDKNGIQRMMLNNEFIFQYGPLDQGWWPDGLYTAPTEEALKFDIVKTKAMGFNMIRKHVKVEPARWYYECDRSGMLVWQDMPSGDLGNHWQSNPGLYGGTDKNRTPESEAIYRKEWEQIISALYHFPCIVVWTPFNEAWGQFKTKEIADWTRKLDPTRLVNSASGGNYVVAGDLLDLHHYPDPAMPRPDLFGATQALVLGEFGGLGLPVNGHTWKLKDNWGYQTFKTADEMLEKYSSFMIRMRHLIEKGLSAAVYTQTTDVEQETNGLMTYDRRILKMPEQKLKQVHDQLYLPLL